MMLGQLMAGWEITFYYLAVLTCVVLVMKISSWWLVGNRKGGSAGFWVAPSLCLPEWQGRRTISPGQGKQLAVRCCCLFGAVWGGYAVVMPSVAGLHWWLQGYAAIVPFWLLLESAQTVLQLAWLPTGRLVPPFFVNPYRSGSLAEFWGRRWNRLFGCWLHQVCFKPFARRPVIAAAIAFTVSGFIHELVVTLPALLVDDETGKSVAGLLLVYFLIQYIGLILGRRWLRGRPLALRLQFLIIVLGPAPLVLNPATLSIFRLMTLP